MNWFRFSSVFRFLIGTLITQAATVALVIVALQGPLDKTWIVLLVLLLMTGLFAALWFASIANHVRNQAVARTKEGFSREREKLRARAEAEKTKLLKESHQRIAKETSRAQTKANLKLKTAFAGLLALGGFMLFTQFMTLGLLTITTVGGALGGYVVGVRQDILGRRRKKAGPLDHDVQPMKHIVSRRTPTALLDLFRKAHTN